jgi:hypothetical protein
MLFFQQNPFAVDTARGLAVRLGRKVEHVEPVLDRLVDLAILVRVQEGEVTVYRFTHPDATTIR